MITDIKTTIRTAPVADAALVSLLGGPRVYQLDAPKVAEFPRITFFELDNADSDFADDAAYASEVSVQIDVWSKGSTSSISGHVDTAMKTIGFYRTSAADLYERDTEIYHKAMRYRAKFEEE